MKKNNMCVTLVHANEHRYCEIGSYDKNHLFWLLEDDYKFASIRYLLTQNLYN